MKWRSIPLAAIARQFISGGTPNRKNPDFWVGTIPWITGADVVDGKVVTGRRFISQSAVAESAANVVPRGGVLLVTRTGVGKVALANEDIAISQDLTGILLGDGFVPAFVMWAIRSQINSLIAVQRGATIKGVLRNDVERIAIPFIGGSEQRRIVELLEQADGLRRQRAEADALANRIIPALFHKMFGDPATNPKGWYQRKLGDVITEAAYGTSNPSNSNGEGLPVLRMNNITVDGRLDLTDLKHVALDESETEKQMLRTGDLLFNRTNSKELVGKTGLWRGTHRAVAASYLIRVRVDSAQVVPDYVWAWMNTSHFKQRLFDMTRRAVGMANINATELRVMPILVPEMRRQKAFGALLESIETLFDHRSESARQLERLFAVMLHRAFSGELTAKWREAHLKELLIEMEQQTTTLRAASKHEYGGDHG